MKLFYKLNAPSNPIVEDFKFPIENPPPSGYWIYGPSIVKEEVKDYFLKTTGLNVSLAVLFCRLNMPAYVNRNNQGVIHSDITWNNGWEQMYYAVNWELFDTTSKLSWWETSENKIYPPDPNPVTLSDSLRGIHYGKRSNMEPLNSNYRKIDSVVIDGNPTLVNTALPHSVDYFGYNKKRWALSIRFDKKVSNWDESVLFFESIIKK